MRFFILHTKLVDIDLGLMFLTLSNKVGSTNIAGYKDVLYKHLNALFMLNR